ncbi:hypothetical protein KY334_01590 [Candidatus Woesearchaeota archaeon]|nr:hypothetical protein [Candidatus Woesearchaeota archaeon]
MNNIKKLNGFRIIYLFKEDISYEKFLSKSDSFFKLEKELSKEDFELLSICIYEVLNKIFKEPNFFEKEYPNNMPFFYETLNLIYNNEKLFENKEKITFEEFINKFNKGEIKKPCFQIIYFLLLNLNKEIVKNFRADHEFYNIYREQFKYKELQNNHFVLRTKTKDPIINNVEELIKNEKDFFPICELNDIKIKKLSEKYHDKFSINYDEFLIALEVSKKLIEISLKRKINLNEDIFQEINKISEKYDSEDFLFNKCHKLSMFIIIYVCFDLNLRNIILDDFRYEVTTKMIKKMKKQPGKDIKSFTEKSKSIIEKADTICNECESKDVIYKTNTKEFICRKCGNIFYLKNEENNENN